MRLAVLTTGRQDWGILRSTCLLLRDDAAFDLRLLVGGMHLGPRFGETYRLIESDGFATAERIAWNVEAPIATQAAAALDGVAGALARTEPDALMLLGDRFETAAAALAATLARVPIVHLHGGEQTEGAFDDALRHAISKLSHLHFVSHDEYRRRLLALGEAPATVHVVGAPGLDNLRRADLADRAELESLLGMPLAAPLIVVTVHPTTLAAAPLADAEAVAAAMARVAATWVVTLPNNDPGAAEIRSLLLRAADGPRRRAVEALGERRYLGLLRHADAVLGNSSSAVIEAPAIGVPVVNVGDRQKGRLRSAHVQDVAADADAIVAALGRALDPATRSTLSSIAGALGDGHAGERIVRVLRDWTPPRPPRKAPVPA
ncbi:MAG TPA: UDP-N-acetylglucosamine 2-epimerase [Polyangia bacterium]|nr:UDP-N-acetylglucosamine 2-epimerase [Polyangia bacterium]